MTPKRLAVISYHTCPLSDEKGTEIGGMNTYVLELSKELVKLGYTIDIFTRSQDPESPKVVQVAPRLRVIHLPAGVEAPLSKKEVTIYLPEFVKQFFAFVETEDAAYDAVSCHYYLSGLIGLEIKKQLHIPMLITFHTLALMKNLVARSEAEKESFERFQAESLLVQEADKVIATSENDALYLETLYNCKHKKLEVLTPGVDLARFHPIEKAVAKKRIGAESHHKLILFVGRIEPLKGIDVLMYALKILVQKNPEQKICLWIVGGDISHDISEWSQELQKLEKIRKILGIATEVTFVGQKKPDELPYYYAAAEVAVMPSHYESFGITALEAMASGIPVITTDATGVSGVFDKKHRHLVTSANNPVRLAEKIQELLTDKQLHQHASREVFEKVQDLSWERIVKRFSGFCIACCKQC